MPIVGLLDQMPQRDVVWWTCTIAAYTRRGYAQEALRAFNDMQRDGIRPNQFTFASVLPAYADLAALNEGKLVHEHIIRSGFQSDVFVANNLVSMYVKCGRVDDARQVFDKIAQRNVVTWTAMVAGYAQNGHVDEALKLFLKMPERNVVSWNAMVAGYGQNEHVGEALCFFQNIPERNVVSWNAMISCCARNGYVDEAVQLFQKMSERNVVSWTAMIAGNAQNGRFNEAMKLFQQMQLTGTKPDSNSFTSILPACAHLSVLHEGKGIHGHVVRSGFHSDVLVENALVDTYAKCGRIDSARQVFDRMHKRDAVSWTAMIVGYAIHGCGKEALQLFGQMQSSGTQPDHVTFIGILSACCHAGQVNDGWQYFHSMSLDYNITPAVEHYCCMVDLLGRAGRLDDAHEFINNMPIKPNAAVWGSLLGACRTHMNIELGECVAEHLFELDPRTAAHYVLLSNIYAAAGRWDEVEKVRRLMKERKVTKMPGCSWVRINNKMYGFLTGDKSHPQAHKIYAMLDRLSGQMKEAGYMPATNFVLHDVEQEQKECILSHHSEKLAVAFGLINTSHGTPIQVVKNLRVCDDCHSAIKIISNIVAREIVMRDANRFHHFKDGWCSCGDYW